MDPGDALFLAISFVLIFAYTAWNIWRVRKSARLYRQLHELLRKSEDHPADPTK